MEQREFGKTGLKVSVLGFGGSEIGEHSVGQRVAARVLGAALDAGVNVIDTAECYAGSEGLIGKAVSHRRAEYHLFTKCGHANGFSDRFRYSEWDPRLLERTIEHSLRNLKTDHLDLLQLHSCSEATLRQGEVIEVLKRARQAGKTRFIGYSGDSDAALYAVESGEFDALQISVSVADQEAIDKALPAAVAHGLGVIAKRPIANAAWLPGKMDGYSRPYRDRLRKLDFDFIKRDQRGAPATALRFTLSVPGVHTAIVGTIKPERFAHNAQALEAGPLGAEEFDAIRARWKQVARPDWLGQT
jgi:aryl-alcohol dehydrogenase-like predicted oxidoreductase